MSLVSIIRQYRDFKELKAEFEEAGITFKKFPTMWKMMKKGHGACNYLADAVVRANIDNPNDSKGFYDVVEKIDYGEGNRASLEVRRIMQLRSQKLLSRVVDSNFSSATRIQREYKDLFGKDINVRQLLEYKYDPVSLKEAEEDYRKFEEEFNNLIEEKKKEIGLSNEVVSEKAKEESSLSDIEFDFIEEPGTELIGDVKNKEEKKVITQPKTYAGALKAKTMEFNKIIKAQEKVKVSCEACKNEVESLYEEFASINSAEVTMDTIKDLVKRLNLVKKKIERAKVKFSKAILVGDCLKEDCQSAGIEPLDYDGLKAAFTAYVENFESKIQDAEQVIKKPTSLKLSQIIGNAVENEDFLRELLSINSYTRNAIKEFAKTPEEVEQKCIELAKEALDMIKEKENINLYRVNGTKEGMSEIDVIAGAIKRRFLSSNLVKDLFDEEFVKELTKQLDVNNIKYHANISSSMLVEDSERKQIIISRIKDKFVPKKNVEVVQEEQIPTEEI